MWVWLRSRRAGSARSGGFSLMELLAVLAIVAVAAGVALPRIGRLLATSRLERAASTAAGDLRLAEALAARQGRAAVFRVDSVGGYSVTDRLTSAVLAARSLRSDFGLTAISAQPTQVTFFPGGTASGPLTLTLSAGTGVRTVRMTRAGLVRVE